MEKTEKSIDLASLDCSAAAERGAELELVHPASGAPLGMHITLLGTDSATWRAAVSSRLTDGRNRRKSLEQINVENCDIFAACTLGWRGLVLDGQELPFSRDAAAKLYRRFPWIREQVDSFMGERANFLPR